MKKRKLAAAIVLASLCVAAVNPQPVSRAGMVSNEEADAYIVMIDDIAAEQVFSQVKEISFVENNVISTGLTDAEVENMKKTDGIEAVEKDIDIVALGQEQSQKETEAEWNMQMIHADTKKHGADSGKIKVAVVDSGINYSDDINVADRKNFVEGDNNISILYEDGSGHGTAVAGIIAAKNNDIGISGVAPDVEIYSARVLDDKNHASLSKVVAAIEWAMEKDVNIINLSLGGTQDSEVLHNVLKKAKKHGILVIAAAGNGGAVRYPAAYDEVLAVGSIGADGTISGNSSVGSQIELVAPGEQILSTGMFDGVMTCGGSSMAAAHVTGVAAALWGQDSSMSSEFIRKLMDVSARAYDDKETYGYGLVDLENSYANYDKVKDSYEDNIEIEELADAVDIGKNEAVVDIYDEVGYVEGLWGTNQHQMLAEQGVYSGTDLGIIKRGAIANDTYIQGMTANPQWHGFYKNTANQNVNYVACYIFLTQLAQNIENGSFDSTWISGMSSLDYYAMANVVNSTGVNGAHWNYVLNGYTINNRNLKLFIYGMALHIATDTFAHSAYDSSGSRIVHGKYTDYTGRKTYVGAAHDESIYPNRYTCSKEIAGKVLNRCNNNLTGSVSDFYLSNYKGDFKLKNIAQNISALDPHFYNVYKSYFDNMTI